eukprot:CAMPEP_0198132782 /NCGR_PEP_ID=MMETSP1442-20131203/59096_1 /TAXON_ID= /ORGANISM="Craspedostauros australis, Strain CCMP3328" /LENGTH=39 /DNA_ID= /DNA_START= /DNA_END= /DNA_ORIENTATION=
MKVDDADDDDRKDDDGDVDVDDKDNAADGFGGNNGTDTK